MKSDWQIKKLGDLCKIELGKTPYRGNLDYWDIKKKTNNVWLSIADLLNTNGKVIADSKEYISDEGARLSKVVKAGTLIASFKLTLGRLAFTGKDLYTNEAIAAITINDESEISKEYLYQYLSFFDWDGEAKGDVKVKGKTLNKAKLKEIKVIYPKSLSEQQHIVNILDDAFEKIDKAKENTQKNLQKAKDVFEAYQNNIFTVQNNNWENKKLGECFKLKSGDNITSKMMDDNEKYPVYGGNGIAGKYKNFNLSGSNIIVGRVGALCGNVRHISEEVWLTDNGFKIVDFKFDFDHDFLTYLLNYKNLRRYARQAAQPVISNSSLESVLLHFPMSLAEQKSIVLRLISISNNIKKLESVYHQKLIGLDKLKKSILNKAFSGEL